MKNLFKKITCIFMIIVVVMNSITIYAGTGSEGSSDLTGGTYYPNYAPCGGYKFTIYDASGSALLSKIVFPGSKPGNTLNVNGCNGKYPFGERTIDLSSVDGASDIVWSANCPKIYGEYLITNMIIKKENADYVQWAQVGNNLSPQFLALMNEIGATSLVGGDFQTWLTTDSTSSPGERPFVTCEPVSFIMPKSAYGTKNKDDVFEVGKINTDTDGKYKTTTYTSMTWKLETYREMKADPEVYYPYILKDVIKIASTGGVEGLQKAKAKMAGVGFVDEGGTFYGVGLTSGWSLGDSGGGGGTPTPPPPSSNEKPNTGTTAEMELYDNEISYFYSLTNSSSGANREIKAIINNGGTQHPVNVCKKLNCSSKTSGDFTVTVGHTTVGDDYIILGTQIGDGGYSKRCTEQETWTVVAQGGLNQWVTGYRNKSKDLRTIYNSPLSSRETTGNGSDTITQFANYGISGANYEPVSKYGGGSGDWTDDVVTTYDIQISGQTEICGKECSGGCHCDGCDCDSDE